MGHQPFRVLFKLGSPLIIGGYPLHLDALLMHELAVETFGARAYNRSQEELEELSLPLKQSGEHYPIWHASQGRALSPMRWGKDLFTRNTYTDYATREKAIPSDFVDYNSAISIETLTGGPSGSQEAGPYRGVKAYLSYIATPGFAFYGNGDINKVRELLKDVVALGSDRNRGYGRVLSMKVTPVKKDYSVWAKDGSPARFLPLDDWSSPIGARGGKMDWSVPSPPYWDSARRVLGYAPAGIVLMEEDEKKELQAAKRAEEDEEEIDWEED